MQYVVLNKVLRIFVMLALASIIPILVFFVIYTRDIGPLEKYPVYHGTCGQRASLYIPCGLNLTENICMNRGCCFREEYGCYHFYPSKHQYMTVLNHEVSNHIYTLVPMVQTVPFGNTPMADLRFSVSATSNHSVQVNLWNPSSSSASAVPGDAEIRDDSLFYYNITEPTLALRIYRKEDSKLLLTTYPGPFIVSLNYLELVIYMGSDILIGLDELHLKPGFRRTLLNNENRAPMPIIWAHDLETGKYHGLLLKATYPLEVEVTESYMIILRGIFDNVGFSFELIIGDGMADVLQKITSIFDDKYGPRPFFDNTVLKYGLHICDQDSERSVYNQTLEIEKYLDPDVLSSVPFDSHCVRENGLYMNSDSVQFDYLDKFREHNKSTMATLVLALKYDEYSNETLAIEYSDFLFRAANNESQIYLGLHAKNRIAYWDWSNSPGDNLARLLSNVTEAIRKYDGLILQSNWMQDNSDNAKAPFGGFFPYVPADLEDTMAQLVPWLVRTSDPSHRQLLRNYNFFGTEAVRVLVQYLSNVTDHLLVMAESSLYPHTNTVFRNKLEPSWVELRSSLKQILANSISGIFSSAASICHDGNQKKDSAEGEDESRVLNEELCIRWYQFASMTPIYRVDVSKSPINFGNFDRKLIGRATRRRYSLSTYFDTLSRKFPNRPLNTPLFFDYPEYLGIAEVAVNEAVERQFMVGDGLMVVPVLLPRIREMSIFFPDLFYEFESGAEMPLKSSATMSVVQDDLPMFVKAGHIVPVHDSHEALTVHEARQMPFSLLVAFKWYSSDFAEATGLISFEPQYSVQMTAIYERLDSITITFSSTNSANEIGGSHPVSDIVKSFQFFGMAHGNSNPNVERNFIVFADHPIKPSNLTANGEYHNVIRIPLLDMMANQEKSMGFLGILAK